VNIKRYDIHGYEWDETEDKNGDWVKWSDVERLLELRAAEAKELEAWRNHSEKCKNAIKMGIMAATNAARRAANIGENS